MKNYSTTGTLCIKTRGFPFMRILLTVVTFTCILPGTGSAQLYVGSDLPGPMQVGTYDASTGAAMNSSFITSFGISGPSALLLSGNILYVASAAAVTAYNATTAAVITSFGTGFPAFIGGLALSGNILYVTNEATGTNTVKTYDATTGAALSLTINLGTRPSGIAVSGNTLYVAEENANLVIGFNAITGAATGFSIPVTFPQSLALSGNNLYVGYGAGTARYDATTGAAIPFSSPIIGGSLGVAISGDNLYVAFAGAGNVSEFDATTGAPITSFGTSGSITVNGANTLAVAQVPEPTTLALAAIGALTLIGRNIRRRRG